MSSKVTSTEAAPGDEGEGRVSRERKPAQRGGGEECGVVYVAGWVNSCEAMCKRQVGENGE